MVDVLTTEWPVLDDTDGDIPPAAYHHPQPPPPDLSEEKILYPRSLAHRKKLSPIEVRPFPLTEPGSPLSDASNKPPPPPRSLTSPHPHDRPIRTGDAESSLSQARTSSWLPQRRTRTPRSTSPVIRSGSAPFARARDQRYYPDIRYVLSPGYGSSLVRV